MLQICKNLAADRLRQRLNRRKLTLREIVEGGRRVGNRVLHDAILRTEPFFEHANRRRPTSTADGSRERYVFWTDGDAILSVAAVGLGG